MQDGWQGTVLPSGCASPGGGCPNLELIRPRGDPHSGLSSPQEPGNGLGEAGERADAGPAGPPNHQQRLEHIVRRAVVEDKVRGLQFLPNFLPARTLAARDWLSLLVFIYF